MDKQSIINEFSNFLVSLNAKYPLSHSGGTVQGMMNKIRSFQSNVKSIANELTNKSNELLAKTDDDEKDDVQKVIVEKGKEFMKEYRNQMR